MSRLLITERLPKPPTELPDGCALIAPDAVTLASCAVPAMTLYRSAKDGLKRKGFGIASPIVAADALRTAVRRVLPYAHAPAVARHHRETIAAILRSGIDTGMLAAAGSRRARNAALIASAYRDILKRLRLVDRDAVFAEAVQQDTVAKRPVFIYGYFRARQLPARNEELEYIDRLAADGSTFYLPCGDDAVFAANRQWIETLVDRGWVISEAHAGPLDEASPIERLALTFAEGRIGDEPETNEHAAAFEYKSLDDEVRGTLARAKSVAIAGTPLKRIAIACRDMDTYAGRLISVSEEYGLPVETRFEIPLAETAFGEFVSLIFEAVGELGNEDGRDGESEGFDYEPTIRLLLHRYGPGLSADEHAAAFSKLPGDLAGWREITDQVELLVAPGERRLGDWKIWLAGVLSRWEMRLPSKLGASAEEIRAYEAFFDSLDDLARERGPDPIAFSRFAGEAIDILSTVSTPLHTARGGIPILQPNEIVGGSFDVIFVVGMAEGMLPARTTDSSVIDLYEVEELRCHGIDFQNALEVPRWEALSFYFMLLAAQKSVVFSYPMFAGDAEQIASSYFKQLRVQLAKPDERFASDMREFRQAFLEGTAAGDDHVLAAARRQYEIEKARESDLPPDEFDGVIGEAVTRRSWSASSLARLGSCPFKWFASDILKLRTPEEADTDLPPTTRGTLLHKTLELAVGRSRSSPDIRASVVEMLEAAFAEAEALDESLMLVTNWSLRRTEQIEKLRMAVASKHFVDEGVEILEVEKPFEAELCGLTIKGTIDRIDRLADGRVLAVDYKHGSYVAKVKDEDGYLEVEIQLPLYTVAALPKLYPEAAAAGGRFFQISERKKIVAKEIDIEAFLMRMKAILDTGNFAVDPDLKGKACTYCDFDVVCRVGPRLARKPH